MMIVNEDRPNDGRGYVPVFADAAGRKFIFMKENFAGPVEWAYGYTKQEAVCMGNAIRVPEGCAFLGMALPMQEDIAGIGGYAQRGEEFMEVLIIDCAELDERIRNQ